MSNAEVAVEKFSALVDLEKATGTKTTRARNQVLRELTDSDLTEVALKLKGAGLIYAFAPLYDPAAK